MLWNEATITDDPPSEVAQSVLEELVLAADRAAPPGFATLFEELVESRRDTYAFEPRALVAVVAVDEPGGRRVTVAAHSLP